jgi:putative transposase
VIRYRWVDDRKAEQFPVLAACKVAGVAPSAYYDWKARDAAGPTPGQLAEAELVATIRRIHQDNDGTYGAPRVSGELAREHPGLGPVNPKRVTRLMRKHKIVGVHQRRAPRTTIPAETNPPVPDLVGRRFAPGVADVAWASDITYIPTGEGWLYLASMLDLGSRRLLGYAMADHMRAELVCDALTMAVDLRGGPAWVKGTVAHSDRGSQYMGHDYTQACKDFGLLQSAGRVGTCFDNAVAEAFWSSLKRELVDRPGRRFATRAEARRAIFAWINRYNTRRLHSSLGMVPPVEWENSHPRRFTLPVIAAQEVAA